MLTCVTASVDSAESVCVVWWDGSYTISKDIINPQRPLVTTHDTISSAGPGSLLKTIPAVIWLRWSLKVTRLRPVSLFPSMFYCIQIGTIWSPAFKPGQVQLAGYHGNMFDETTWCDTKQCGYLWILPRGTTLITHYKPLNVKKKEKNRSVQNITPWKGNGNATQFRINYPYILSTIMLKC